MSTRIGAVEILMVVLFLASSLMLSCSKEDRQPDRPPIRSITLGMAEADMLAIMPPYDAYKTGWQKLPGKAYAWFGGTPFDYGYYECYVGTSNGLVDRIYIEERVKRSEAPSVGLVSVGMAEDEMLRVMGDSNKLRMSIYPNYNRVECWYEWCDSQGGTPYDIDIDCKNGKVTGIYKNGQVIDAHPQMD